MEMENFWLVTWNPKLYDYQRLIDDFKKGKIKKIIQSKGMAKMIYVPQINDTVYVSCHKKKIMKCKVLTIFKRGTDQIMDKYNLGLVRKHTENNQYLTMEILEVYDEPEYMKGYQRTWTQKNSNKIDY